MTQLDTGRAAKRGTLSLLVASAAVVGLGFSVGVDPVPAKAAPRVRTLTIGAYTTPREVYGREILPAFARAWKARTGDDVKFQESYLGSGAQARAIVQGFEADVAALSLEADVETIARAKLITRDWKKAASGGMVSRSVVVLAVRPGNPKGIKDWDDLRKPGLDVLTPNPKTSGGAMWNIAAVYGAVLRGKTSAPPNVQGAERYLAEILRNVSIMDKGARESMLTFEGGTGDVAITYENEVLVARQSGKKMDYVIPRSTILIENPVAVVDVYAEAHGNRDLADAFVQFLASAQAQEAYARYGLRPVDARVAATTKYAKPADLFTIRDLGDWPVVKKTLFGPTGAFERASARTAAR